MIVLRDASLRRSAQDGALMDTRYGQPKKPKSHNRSGFRLRAFHSIAPRSDAPGTPLPLGFASLTPANRLKKGILRSAQDFACGLPLGFASLTPANRLKKGILRSAQDFACGLPLGFA